ncbi:hypothetical protein CR513_28036, partial [Mucuna pruriens]
MMRKRFVPTLYEREIHHKLQSLYQGSRNEEEYHKDMELTLLRSHIREREEATIARFLHGLNREIQDIVELRSYSSLGALVYQAVKVEMQLKRKSASRRGKTSSRRWFRPKEFVAQRPTNQGPKIGPKYTKKGPTKRWLSECGELVVERQVEVSFTIGKYKDKVLCDMVPMEVTHLLLGRSWQYDKKVIHDGVTNRFTFAHMGQKVVLKPLSLKAAQEDKKKERKEKKEREVILREIEK